MWRICCCLYKKIFRFVMSLNIRIVSAKKHEDRKVSLDMRRPGKRTDKANRQDFGILTRNVRICFC